MPEIFREQTRLLYANSKGPVIVSILVGGLLCWSMRHVINQAVLVSWFVVFLAISIVRFLLVCLFKDDAEDDRLRSFWHKHFLISTYAIAAVWGAAAFLLFPEHSPSEQLVYFIIVLGVAAGAIASLCPSLPVVGGFLSLLLVPLIAKLMSLGHGDAWFNGFLLLIFWCFTFIAAVKIHVNIRDKIRLHLQSVGREKILKVSEERYRHIFGNAPLGILHYDGSGIIMDCNDAFVKILGSSKDLLVGLEMFDRLKDPEILAAVEDSLKGGEGYYEGEYTAITGDTTTPIRAFFRAIESIDGTIIGGVGIVEDFTEQKHAEQSIQYYASYDPLTGLANRRLLLDQLKNEMARARRYGHYGALLYLDLDNFKTINDSLGHSVGDELLKIVADRITGCTREEDTVARMGGDEFVVLVTELDKTVGLSSYKASGIAEEISLCISAPCHIEGRELHVTPSIGVAIFPVSDRGIDDILKQADSAMYRAKAGGRNAIRFFLPNMQKAADDRLDLNTEIRSALRKGQFSLLFQPQVESSGKLVGAEALLRWDHPERGMVPPDAFIDLAEETGIMVEIGEWVLRKTCLLIREWTDAGQLDGGQIISVNIGGKEIAAPNSVDRIIKIMEETGVDPNRLGFELTEGSLVSTKQDIVYKIQQLRQMGIKFSVDDFGTGYSSLSYLKRLPLNTIKIDSSFVNDIHDGDEEVVLVDTIILMANKLGLEVIAEGVETEEELLYLKSRGCDVYQGFYYSQPVSVETFTGFLKSGSVTSLAPVER